MEAACKAENPIIALAKLVIFAGVSKQMDAHHHNPLSGSISSHEAHIDQQYYRVLGYARVSTKDQNLTYQVKRLTESGCQKIYMEKRSGKARDGRPELGHLLRVLRPGDLVLATVTDRIARDPVDLLNIVQEVKRAGAALKLVDEPFIDTTSEICDLVLFIIGWAARWQRLRILENTAHGRAIARQKGVKFGRKPKLNPDVRLLVSERLGNGESRAELAKEFGVSESTITRLTISSKARS